MLERQLNFTTSMVIGEGFNNDKGVVGLVSKGEK
jgi:hypothetical protein